MPRGWEVEGGGLGPKKPHRISRFEAQRTILTRAITIKGENWIFLSVHRARVYGGMGDAFVTRKKYNRSSLASYFTDRGQHCCRFLAHARLFRIVSCRKVSSFITPSNPPPTKHAFFCHWNFFPHSSLATCHRISIIKHLNLYSNTLNL